MACERPGDSDSDRASFRDIWTYSSLHQTVVEKGIIISRSEVYRTLHDRQLRPHRIKMWLNSQDPEFRAKANRICKLYLKPPKAAALLCVDEKTGMQALERKHPMRFAAPGRPGRNEYEYIRHGTQTLIAAFDVRTGKVFGRCGHTRSADDLIVFMENLAVLYPKGPVYIVWDNLNIHHGERWNQFNARHDNRFRFIHTPLHASWVNQVEIWFGIFHKRVLKYGSFRTEQELAHRAYGFINYWNLREAHPFRWSFRGFRIKAGLRKAA